MQNGQFFKIRYGYELHICVILKHFRRQLVSQWARVGCLRYKMFFDLTFVSTTSKHVISISRARESIYL